MTNSLTPFPRVEFAASHGNATVQPNAGGGANRGAVTRSAPGHPRVPIQVIIVRRAVRIDRT